MPDKPTSKRTAEEETEKSRKNAAAQQRYRDREKKRKEEARERERSQHSPEAQTTSSKPDDNLDSGGKGSRHPRRRTTYSSGTLPPDTAASLAAKEAAAQRAKDKKNAKAREKRAAQPGRVNVNKVHRRDKEEAVNYFAQNPLSQKQLYEEPASYGSRPPNPVPGVTDMYNDYPLGMTEQYQSRIAGDAYDFTAVSSTLPPQSRSVYQSHGGQYPVPSASARGLGQQAEAPLPDFSTRNDRVVSGNSEIRRVLDMSETRDSRASGPAQQHSQPQATLIGDYQGPRVRLETSRNRPIVPGGFEDEVYKTEENREKEKVAKARAAEREAIKAESERIRMAKIEATRARIAEIKATKARKAEDQASHRPIRPAMARPHAYILPSEPATIRHSRPRRSDSASSEPDAIRRRRTERPESPHRARPSDPATIRHSRPRRSDSASSEPEASPRSRTERPESPHKARQPEKPSKKPRRN
ncbi:hypothetical protein P7C71_g3629, partial [Lecanoromycetidae sp. Uapishka_2]